MKVNLILIQKFILVSAFGNILFFQAFFLFTSLLSILVNYKLFPLSKVNENGRRKYICIWSTLSSLWCIILGKYIRCSTYASCTPLFLSCATFKFKKTWKFSKYPIITFLHPFPPSSWQCMLQWRRAPPQSAMTNDRGKMYFTVPQQNQRGGEALRASNLQPHFLEP